ncbi:hypothetical protein [Clostridium kluyveri]|uniref:hypothetical protein n=1 Tax=Clostridium kluyveri TaxID=1534 RepID=UPI002247FB82|nr:hypothetical protein [Clostridium kluyveri]UZQ49963.1 hypothetical protein OP486_18745 [Clostridium kluyveri]
MSEILIAALIGAGATLMVTIITQISTVYISRFKENLEIKQKEFQIKRDNLSGIYKTLTSVINSFPNESPNDVLKNIECSPNYSVENFNAVLKILDYQIEDYRNQLKNVNISYEQKNDIDVQISNREYSKKKISEIRDKYYKARDYYKSFCESDKMIFDLYAGQNVRNALVRFEVVIHNVFISGHSVGDVYDPLNNSIEITRWNLIDSMRNDLGINRNI